MTTTTVGRTTVYAFGRCPVRDCKRLTRLTLVDMPVMWWSAGRREYTELRVPAAEPYGHIVVPQAATVADLWRRRAYEQASYRAKPSAHLYDRTRHAAMQAAGLICEEHDCFMYLVPVKGVLNVDKSCDGRCMNAIGPNCECSCAGENHGASWSL